MAQWESQVPGGNRCMKKTISQKPFVRCPLKCTLIEKKSIYTNGIDRGPRKMIYENNFKSKIFPFKCSKSNEKVPPKYYHS